MKELIKDIEKSDVIPYLSQRINDYMVLSTANQYPLLNYLRTASFVSKADGTIQSFTSSPKLMNEMTLRNGNIEIMYHDYTLGHNDIKAYDTNADSVNFDSMFKADNEPAFRELHCINIHWYKKIRMLSSIYNNIHTSDEAFKTLYDTLVPIEKAKMKEDWVWLLKNVNTASNYDFKLEVTPEGDTEDEQVRSIITQIRQRLNKLKVPSRKHLTRKPYNIKEDGTKDTAKTALEYGINDKKLVICLENSFYTKYINLLSNTFNKELLQFEVEFQSIDFDVLLEALDEKVAFTSTSIKNKFTYTKEVLDASKTIMFAFDVNWLTKANWYKGAVDVQTMFPNVTIKHNYASFDYFFRKDALAFYVQLADGTKIENKKVQE